MIKQATVLETCNKIIFQIINRIFENPSEMNGFIQLIANIPFLELDNLLLLYAQKPDAKILAGYGAWHDIGRTVNPHQMPIILRKISIVQNQAPTPKYINNQPTFDENGNFQYEDYGKYDVNFEAVYVFDLSQTSGSSLNIDYFTHNDINFYKVFTENTQSSIRIDENNLYLNTHEKSKYVPEENILYISKDLSDYEREKEYLAQLVYVTMQQYIVDEPTNVGMFMTQCVNWIIKKIYGYTTPNDKFFFHIDFDSSMYFYIMRHILYYTNTIIESIDGATYLSFNETAVLNYLYNKFPQSKKDVYFHRICTACEKSSNDPECQNILNRLNSKLDTTTIKSQRNIYRLREAKKLFSFPPVKLYKELNV